MTTLLRFNNLFFNNFFCLLFQLVLVEKRQVKSLPSAHQFFSFGLDLVLLFFFRLSSPLPPTSLPDPEDEDEDDDPLPELLPEPELLLPLSLLLPEEDEEEEEEEEEEDEDCPPRLFDDFFLLRLPFGLAAFRFLWPRPLIRSNGWPCACGVAVVAALLLLAWRRRR